jgi:integrase/recombinase XerD
VPPPAPQEGQDATYGQATDLARIDVPGVEKQRLPCLCGSPSQMPVGAGHPFALDVRDQILLLAARAGIRADVSPQWLHPAHATRALERGAPIHLVKDTLGHASVATTDNYLHAKPTESSAKYLAV